MNRVLIAAIAHTLNAALCEAIGDHSQPAWAQAPDWQKESALAGVDMHLANPEATPEQSHAAWMEHKVKDGWVYGEVKDAEKKTHPCIRPWAELPVEQRIKDHIFRAAVHALSPVPDAPAAGAQALKAAPGGVIPRLVGPQGFAPVKYVGRRETYREGMYATGLVFQRGETKMVPTDKARLLLQHPDVYVPGDVQSMATVQAPPSERSKADEDRQAEERVQEARDAIANMNKDALVAYAQTNFRVALDKHQGVAKLREAATQLVDRFGLAQ